jgi:thiamine pyrophosphokinase
MNNISNIVQYRDFLKIVLLDDHSKIFLLSRKFQKWYTANTILSLMPVGNVEGIFTENLFYPLQNGSLTLGYKSGSSNHVAQDGLVKIEHSEGDLLLMECFD